MTTLGVYGVVGWSGSTVGSSEESHGNTVKYVDLEVGHATMTGTGSDIACTVRTDMVCMLLDLDVDGSVDSLIGIGSNCH